MRVVSSLSEQHPLQARSNLTERTRPVTTIEYLRGSARCYLTVPTADVKRELGQLGSNVVILSAVPVRNAQ